MLKLICEGRCNPEIRQVDNAVGALVKAERAFAAHPPFGDPALWAWQRRLCYTGHEATEREFVYRCVQCGTTRRFGNGKWSPIRGASLSV